MAFTRWSKPSTRPANTAGAEAAANEIQLLEAGTALKDPVEETNDTDEENAKTSKKAPSGGLNNYFVSALLVRWKSLLTSTC
jgi:hypothetical protein